MTVSTSFSASSLRETRITVGSSRRAGIKPEKDESFSPLSADISASSRSRCRWKRGKVPVHFGLHRISTHGFRYYLATVVTSFFGLFRRRPSTRAVIPLGRVERRSAQSISINGCRIRCPGRKRRNATLFAIVASLRAHRTRCTWETVYTR